MLFTGASGAVCRMWRKVCSERCPKSLLCTSGHPRGAGVLLLYCLNVDVGEPWAPIYESWLYVAEVFGVVLQRSG